MFYRLRLADSRQDPYSIIYEVDKEGSIQRSTHNFELKLKRKWKSAVTGIEYPTSIELRVWNQSYELVPTVSSQELSTKLGGNIAYWEGACRVMEKNMVIGRAYLELTGYPTSQDP
jgi:predicted secreted hydrolase